MLASGRKPVPGGALLRGRGRGNAELLAAARPPLRRLADCWGLTPGIGAPHETVTLTTRDGVRLAASYLPGPDGGAGPAVLIAPGFAGHRTKPAYALLAERLAQRVGVLAVDLRGHGGSGGRCTFGVREVLDVVAAADWLRARGHRWVAAIGASMGGAAVLRAAGLDRRGRFAAVCAISSPARWGLAETPAMRGISRTVTVGWYRALVGGLLHVRIAPNPWAAGAGAEPAAPLALVEAIAPVPLLLVHGSDDHYLRPSQAELLHAAAAEPRALWLEPAGFGHAEDGLRRAFADDLARAVLTCAATGSWPLTRSGGLP